jgi:NitT/TauT family transport system substrate-binding protein
MKVFDALPAIGLAFCVAAAPAARAEVSEVVLGQQFGTGYLPAMVMEVHKLVEKHLVTAGVADTKVTWAKLGGPAALNDATLSGSLHFSCQGAPSSAIIWDRTKTTIGVKSLGAIASNNIWLNTRNKDIKTIKDFTEKDRIAIPSLKVSTQALLLHYLAAQTWGDSNYTKLDSITVSLPHPDAMTAVMNSVSEINSHFATSPFHEIEMNAGLKTITTAYEIMGGTTTGLNFVSNEKFRSENPKVFGAVFKAYVEAIDWINSDQLRAAGLYLEISKEKRLTAEELVVSMREKNMEYTRVPANVGKIADFMHKVGLLKSKPASWKDMYFAEAHDLPGT